MLKRTAFVLLVSMAIAAVNPSVTMAGHSRAPGHHHPQHYYYPSHGDDAFFWGLTGLILGTAFLSVVLQPPVQQVPEPYYIVPQVQIYGYPPPVPPGMCRWERYHLDEYGRMILDQYGQPVLEYTLWPCEYPPD